MNNLPDFPKPHPNEPQPASIIRLAWLIYLPMILAGVWVQAPASFTVTAPGAAPPSVAINLAGDSAVGLTVGLAMAVALGATVIAFSRWIVRHSSWGRALRQEFGQVLGCLDSRQILVLSLLSAFGEEILFRGILHGLLGLWPTAILFGLFHFPIRRTLVPWTLFALVLGVVFGGLTTVFASLWPPILLHFVINYSNIHDLVTDPAGTGRG